MTAPFAARGTIAPGRLFLDDRGEVAQLHGVGIARYDGLFYAWGEDKRHGSTFSGVACYSSPDLATWTWRGHALAMDPDCPDLGADRIVERPKVLCNPDGLYVMFLHVDSADYSDARVGWAVSSVPEGPYEYLRSERPLGNLSRDIGVFRDEDGAGYLMSEDRSNGLHIYRLSADYLHVEEIVATTLVRPDHRKDVPHGYESPSMVKHEGIYYLFGSDLTGWSTNDNQYATAHSVKGPWGPWRDFAPVGSATFDSQVSVVFPVEGTDATTYVYVGDRWNPDDLYNSAPVWLPLKLEGSEAALEWRDVWTMDIAEGRIAPSSSSAD